MTSRWLISIGTVIFLLVFTVWWAKSPDGAIDQSVENNTSATDTPQPLVSAIQPIEEGGLPPADNDQLERETDAAQQLTTQRTDQNIIEELKTIIATEDNTAAINALTQLLAAHPNELLLYINLASLQARQGQLQTSRQTLLDGIQSDPAFALLYDYLQEVHGALAANAYQAALSEKAKTITKLELPLLDSMPPPTTIQPDPTAE